MLTIFRRHTRACVEGHSETDPGRQYRRCKCPIHAEGHLGGVMYRRALDTTSWTRAQDLVREREARGTWDDPNENRQVTVAEAAATFLSALAATSSGKARSTTRKFRCLFQGVNPEWVSRTRRECSAGLLDFCRHKGLTTLAELTVPVLTEYVASWTCGPHHRSKRVQLLRRFFRFCVDAEWIGKNPALTVEHPKGRAMQVRPTLPFDPDQMQKILETCKSHPKLLALTLLMRHAGLRISDAATLQKNRVLADGSIFLYAHKTGEPVTIPMHPQLTAALEAVQPNERGHYFCSGASAVTTVTDNWRRRYQQVFQAAGIENGHPHRFRDSFAVDLLLRGVPIDQVSTLLGHSSVKVTERHYVPFVAARRQQIAESLRRVWANGEAA